MPRTGLTQDQMRSAAIDAAEATIRRHGIERTRLVDVARAVGVSHAMLYRLFPDRAALVDAVSARWLERIDHALAAVAHGPGPAAARLRNWFLTLHRLKCEKVRAEPEIYAAFNMAAQSTRPVVRAHLAETNGQLVRLVDEAIGEGALAPGDRQQIATLLFQGTLAFHHPRLVLDTIDQDRQAALGALLDVLLKGLAAPPGTA
jgi:AcrR family transcriptional regulator